MTALRVRLALLVATALVCSSTSPGEQPAGVRKPASGKPAPPAAASAATPKIEFEKYTLPNGLQVILHVDRKLPIVNVNQWFHVGSKNEKTGRTGFAHLFEHMMFQGSKNTGDYFVTAEQAGANLQEGGVNGTTNNDRTNYFATVPSGNLERILWLESDRLATLADALTKEKLDNQRDVVKNERRQGLENTPYGRWFKLTTENLHPASHPYSWTVIGSHEDLTAASPEDVKDFFRTYYTPNNLSLVIAGDFDPAEAKRLVEKYFGGIPAGPPLDRPRLWIPTLSGEKIVEATDRVPQERVYMTWPAPQFFGNGDAELDLVSLILTDGLASRLSKVLVYDKQLCSSVNSFSNNAEISGFFTVIATARPEASLSEIERIVTDEIARLAKTGPTAVELGRAKAKYEFGFVSGLERIGGFGGKADVLNKYNTYLGDPASFQEDIVRHRRATVESIRAAADRWLNTRNRLLVRFHPEKSGRASQTALDRSKAPDVGADRPFRAPEVQSAKLSNGMEVFVVERRDLPKVAVTLATRAGSAAAAPGKDGVAYLTARIARLGTKTRKALAIEDSLGDLGTGLDANASREDARLELEVLKRNLDPAVEILADVARNATFPADEFEREKKRHLDALSQQAKNAGAIAGRVRAMLAFGADHPYGRPVQGLPSTVAGLTRDDLAAFHAARWKPGSSVLVFSGDITLAEARALAERTFGGWSGGAAPAVDIPAPSPAPTAGRIYLVDRQDAAQTVVTQFLPAPARSTEDYSALSLADAVWGGGGFSTRLNLNLRQDKGYSYGVFSNLGLFRRGGYWYSSGGVQTNKTKESVVEFDKELKGLAGARPISEAEFAAARATRVRGYAQGFEALSRINGRIADLWSEEIPMTELQREYDEAAKATLAQATAAAQKYAKTDRAGILLVGDRAKIESGVKELKLGEIVVLDAEGKPAK
ncbi:MAG TPA: pitrilysin family protein [Thermoanaerobaculia bacterium]|nr:pitrilysin family protein [Thermoanaerobaculia bacterium]